MKTWQRLLTVIVLIGLGVASSLLVTYWHKYDVAPEKPQAVVAPLQYKFSLIDLTARFNNQRATLGESALLHDPALDAAASAHAKDMHDRGYYNHTTPDGVTAYDRITAATGNSQGSEIQDNICPNATPDREFERFLNSPEHEQVFDSPLITHYGYGIAYSDPGKCNGYVVYDFTR